MTCPAFLLLMNHFKQQLSLWLMTSSQHALVAFNFFFIVSGGHGTAWEYGTKLGLSGLVVLTFTH